MASIVDRVKARLGLAETDLLELPLPAFTMRLPALATDDLHELLRRARELDAGLVRAHEVRWALRDRLVAEHVEEQRGFGAANISPPANLYRKLDVPLADWFVTAQRFGVPFDKLAAAIGARIEMLVEELRRRGVFDAEVAALRKRAKELAAAAFEARRAFLELGRRLTGGRGEAGTWVLGPQDWRDYNAARARAEVAEQALDAVRGQLRDLGGPEAA